MAWFEISFKTKYVSAALSVFLIGNYCYSNYLWSNINDKCDPDAQFPTFALYKIYNSFGAEFCHDMTDPWIIGVNFSIALTIFAAFIFAIGLWTRLIMTVCFVPYLTSSIATYNVFLREGRAPPGFEFEVVLVFLLCIGVHLHALTVRSARLARQRNSNQRDPPI